MNEKARDKEKHLDEREQTGGLRTASVHFHTRQCSIVKKIDTKINGTKCSTKRNTHIYGQAIQ